MATRIMASGRRWVGGLLATVCLATAAWAAIVTAAEVARAVAASPTANALLRANAGAIGSLAMFESNGDTEVYNGSCCYGVLQMNRTNIAAAGYTPEAFRRLPLQDQVNAWAQMQSAALNHPVVGRLRDMGTFDGQPVDFAFLLACVQLGQGNCNRMVRSGRCSGFADVHGTTICDMANATRRHMGLPTATPPTTPPVGTPRPGPIPSPSPGGTRPIDGHGAFFNASGATVETTTGVARAAFAACLILACAIALAGCWGAYFDGSVSRMQAWMSTRGALTVLLLGSLLLL